MVLTEAENYLSSLCSLGQQPDTLVRAAESTAQSLPLLCSQGLPPGPKKVVVLLARLNGLRFSLYPKVAAPQISWVLMWWHRQASCFIQLASKSIRRNAQNLYLAKSVEVIKSSTRNAGGAGIQGMSSEHVFHFSMGCSTVVITPVSERSLDVSTLIFIASQPRAGVVSSPFCWGQMEKQGDRAERSTWGDGVTDLPFKPMNSRYQALAEPCCSNKHTALVQTWPWCPVRGDFPGILEQLTLRDKGCNLQMLSELPDVTQESCDDDTNTIHPKPS